MPPACLLPIRSVPTAYVHTKVYQTTAMPSLSSLLSCPSPHPSPIPTDIALFRWYDSTSEQEMCGLRDQSFLGPRDEQRCRLDPSLLRPTMRPDA